MSELLPDCTHIKEDGMKCGATVVKDSEFCYHHQLHRRRRRQIYNTMIGKAKVLEPYMSGAAAGKDPVTHRVYDGLFAHLVHELDLPPLRNPDDVDTHLTYIQQLIATQQVDPRLTAQMLSSCKTAVANQGNRLKAEYKELMKEMVELKREQLARRKSVKLEPQSHRDTEVLAHGGRAPRKSEDQHQTLTTDDTEKRDSADKALTTENTEIHREEPQETQSDSVASVVEPTGNGKPETKNASQPDEARVEQGFIPAVSDTQSPALAAGAEQQKPLTTDDTETNDHAESSTTGYSTPSGVRDSSTQSAALAAEVTHNESREASTKSPEGTTDGSPACSETERSDVERECGESVTGDSFLSAEGQREAERSAQEEEQVRRAQAPAEGQSEDNVEANNDMRGDEVAAPKANDQGPTTNDTTRNLSRSDALAEGRAKKAAIIEAAKYAEYVEKGIAEQQKYEAGQSRKKQAVSLMRSAATSARGG